MVTKERCMLWRLLLVFFLVLRLQAEECGSGDEDWHIISEGAIREAKPLEYMVSIVINNSSSSLSTKFLTGVLVRNDTVITSAASLPSQESLESISVAIGSLRAGRGEEIIDVKEIVCAKGFRHGEENCFKSQDIAILLLKKPSSKTPIEIISKKDWDSIKDRPEVNLSVKGWFANPQHSIASNPCLANATVSIGMSCMEEPIEEKLVCTERPRTNVPIWSEGAPLIYAHKGKEVVVGVWSYASHTCERKDYSVVYTPLAPLRKWIKFSSKKSKRKTFSCK